MPGHLMREVGTAEIGVTVRKQLVARTDQKNVSPCSWTYIDIYREMPDTLQEVEWRPS